MATGDRVASLATTSTAAAVLTLLQIVVASNIVTPEGEVEPVDHSVVEDFPPVEHPRIPDHHSLLASNQDNISMEQPPDRLSLEPSSDNVSSAQPPGNASSDGEQMNETSGQSLNQKQVSMVSASLCVGSGDCQHLDQVPHTSTNRRKRSTDDPPLRCDLEVFVKAFDQNYTLCLFAKKIKEDDIIKDNYDRVNITVFQEHNKTMDIPISTLELEYITGYVLEEPFSAVNGYLMDHHFFGIINIQDRVHYLEPSLRPSKDLHIYLNGVQSLLGNKTKKQFGSCVPKTCELTVVADHYFYSEVGNNSLHNTVLQILWHLKEANRYLASADFDGDGKSDCIRISVGEITVFTSKNSSVNLLTGAYTLPEDFLKRFSRYNFEGYCLGLLFTSREFDDLVLGLAWRGNPIPDGVGGTCQRRVRIKTDSNTYSFNSLFVTMQSKQEKRIPIKMGVLNLVHEILHSFGAKHDPEPDDRADCTPADKYINGRFLMSKFSNDGHKLNHQILSPCTKEMIATSLKSPTRTDCLKLGTGGVCGNGLVESGEECDCGTPFMCTIKRSCCTSPEGYGDLAPCTKRLNLTNCVDY